MDIPIYENKLPVINENVLVTFTEHKNTHIEATLIEYDSLNGMMLYEDATRKKKVYDWKKELPLNKTMVAKIEEIFSNTYVKLSTRYFDQKIDPTELRKELIKPFSDNKVLIITIKKICKNNDLNVNEFWSKVMYKIINKKKKDDLNGSILDYILDNKDEFKNIINDNYPENCDKIIDEYYQLMSNKIQKIQSKFSLITKTSIENSKELLKLACDNQSWNFTLKYETTPNFILESFDKNSTQENHDAFLQFLKDNSIAFNVNYNKIN